MASEINKATATLGGKPLLMSANVSWTLREGVVPNIQTFDMAPDDALALSKGPFDLVITPPEGKGITVTNLWLLNIQPGDSPFISKVTIADRRWFWSYRHTGPKNYNIRRNVGNKRILSNFSAAVDFDRAPQVAFAPWSLQKNTIRWVARTMLEDVMEDVAEAEKSATGQKFTLVVDSRIGTAIKGLPIESLTIDDAGDSAVRRAIGYLPEAGVYVDYDGKVVIFSRAGGDEAGIVKALMPELRGPGHTDLVKNSAIRPREIHVLFTREVELRFDFLEETRATNQTVVAGSEPADLRRMDNVLPITDYQLQVSEVDTKPLCQGTWITFDQAFRAWEELPLVGADVKLDHPLIQKAFIPQMDLWAALKIAGDRPDEQGTLRNWVGRISACQNHYRRTFRLRRKWMDRIMAIRPYRLSTVDPQSGQRGPATAHGDYAIIYTQRSIWRNRAQGKPLDYAINKTAYPSGGNGASGVPNFNSETEVSPAIVSIVDKDQGIVHVDYVVDPNRVYEMILPSQISQGNNTRTWSAMPTADISDRKRPIAFNAVINANDPPRLSPAFKIAIMLTAVPASPNSNQQLHRIVIKPSDIADLLPAASTVGLGDAKGPIMEIRVGPNTEVARIQWLDSRSTEIEKIFGITEGTPNLDGLVLNVGDTTDAEKGASLKSIAKARAAAVYASLTDRYEGSMTGYMNGNVTMNGWTDEITHTLKPDGQTTTEVKFPPAVPQMSVMSFLDSNARAAILHLVKGEA